MKETIFKYVPSNIQSSIVNIDEFEKNSDEAKLLCLLFGGVVVTKNSEEEIFQKKNHFILDDDDNNYSNIFTHTRIMQSKLQAFEEEIESASDINKGTVVKDLKNLISSLNILLNEEEFHTEESFDDFLLKEFAIKDTEKDLLKRYFQHMSRNNKEFQSTLLFETTMFFFKCELSPTAAFLHLYRIIELICFNVPLVYTSKEFSYIGAFTKLKKFFSKDGEEFAFFKKFLETLFKDEKEMLNEKFCFEIQSDNISSIKADLDNVYSLDKKDKEQNYLWEFNISENQSSALCSISFKNLIDFIINIRNRYFHLSDGSGNPNIKNKTYDMDQVFTQLNFSIINCLSIIMLSVSKYSFSFFSRFYEEN